MKHFCALFLLFTFTVYAQQDQKLPNGQWAFYGEEFYQSLTTKRKIDRSLLDKILNQSHSSSKGKYDVISNNCASGTTCYSHTSVGYGSARHIMFGELDILRDGEGTYVLDVYCGKKFYFRSLEEVGNMHTRVNIEHTWPQSRFNPKFQKEVQKSDMHHLYLTDSLANNVRGNSPFGFVSKSMDRFVGDGGEGCHMSRSGFAKSGHVYTPPSAHRGNVARALFYFSMHYDLPISHSEEKKLREWHKADPIDVNELRRHEGIAKHQNIRNPFVDHPEIVDLITDF